MFTFHTRWPDYDQRMQVIAQYYQMELRLPIRLELQPMELRLS